jgi:glutamate-1-semialdehyde 2,1-aminomutase
MEPAERMFVSSSYWSDNIGLVASLTTIRELKRRNSQERFEHIGETLRAALTEAIDSAGVPARCTGLYSHPHIDFDLPDESLQPKVKTLFVQEMARRGVHCDGTFKASLANDDEDIRLTAKAASEAFEVVRQGLEGRLDELLVADLGQEPFRRMVR